jgi:uncharacterized protein (DUF58 family)
VLAYPSPRAAVAGILLVGVATLGYVWPVAWDAAGLGALLLGVLLLVDLFATAGALRGKLAVEREFPQIVTVARARDGAHVVRNASRLPVRLRVFEDQHPLIAKQQPAQWARVAPGKEARLPLRVAFQRRGEQALGGAGVRVLAGFGLWIVQYRFDWAQRVRVYPLIEELTKGDLFAHRRRLWGIGQHQSKKFGRGTEFDRLREYTPDDEYRLINWKATARAGKPVVNQMQVEQSRDLLLLLDCGRLMHTEIGGRPRLDRYLDAAAHLAYLALGQRDRVGLLAFDQQVRRWVAPGHRARQLDNLIDAMFDLQPQFVESDYATAVTTLKHRQNKRGMVVLFTELIDSVSSKRAIANLARLAKTHLPVVVILDDPAVPALAQRPALAPTDAFVKAAAEQFLSEKRRTLQALRNSGCFIVNTAAERLNTELVNQYLEVKARNLL